MSEKRRDKRGRILHYGEIQMTDGGYRFKYVDVNGKERVVYSWRLDHKYKLLQFAGESGDIADPWYTGNFDVTYGDVARGCEGLLKQLNNE